MKIAILQKPSVHLIPLIILSMLVLYTTSVTAAPTQKAVGVTKSTKFITVAKGQPYVPPQKQRECIKS